MLQEVGGLERRKAMRGVQVCTARCANSGAAVAIPRQLASTVGKSALGRRWLMALQLGNMVL
eukprot:3798074-Lingulodinium_polyedra.AAC.1